MKLFNLFLASALVVVSLSACLKDKAAQEAAPEQTMEQPATPPAEAAPAEAAPADAGTTQTN